MTPIQPWILCFIAIDELIRLGFRLIRPRLLEGRARFHQDVQKTYSAVLLDPFNHPRVQRELRLRLQIKQL